MPTIETTCLPPVRKNQRLKHRPAAGVSQRHTSHLPTWSIYILPSYCTLIKRRLQNTKPKESDPPPQRLDVKNSGPPLSPGESQRHTGTPPKGPRPPIRRSASRCSRAACEPDGTPPPDEFGAQGSSEGGGQERGRRSIDMVREN